MAAAGGGRAGGRTALLNCLRRSGPRRSHPRGPRRSCSGRADGCGLPPPTAWWGDTPAGAVQRSPAWRGPLGHRVDGAAWAAAPSSTVPTPPGPPAAGSTPGTRPKPRSAPVMPQDSRARPSGSSSHRARYQVCGTANKAVLVLLVCRCSVSANRLHGFGRLNLQNTSRHGGIRHRGLSDHLIGLEDAEGKGDAEPDQAACHGSLLCSTLAVMAWPVSRVRRAVSSTSGRHHMNRTSRAYVSLCRNVCSIRRSGTSHSSATDT